MDNPLWPQYVENTVRFLYAITNLRNESERNMYLQLVEDAKYSLETQGKLYRPWPACPKMWRVLHPHESVSEDQVVIREELGYKIVEGPDFVTVPIEQPKEVAREWPPKGAVWTIFGWSLVKR